VFVLFFYLSLSFCCEKKLWPIKEKKKKRKEKKNQRSRKIDLAKKQGHVHNQGSRLSSRRGVFHKFS